MYLLPVLLIAAIVVFVLGVGIPDTAPPAQ